MVSNNSPVIKTYFIVPIKFVNSLIIKTFIVFFESNMYYLQKEKMFLKKLCILLCEAKRPLKPFLKRLLRGAR